MALGTPAKRAKPSGKIASTANDIGGISVLNNVCISTPDEMKFLYVFFFVYLSSSGTAPIQLNHSLTCNGSTLIDVARALYPALFF